MRVRRVQDWLTTGADTRPDATAVRWEETSSTFGELEERTNRVAHVLREMGCRRGDRVAFAIPKSPDAYCILLGALKADCAYVPLDPQGPASRLARILEATEPSCMVVAAGSLDMARDALASVELPEVRIGLLEDAPEGAVVDFDASAVQAMSTQLPESRSTPSDPAHLLFTSGSTGTPKGVIVTHQMVVAFVTWAVEYFGMAEGDRVSGHSPLTFDLSTFDTFGALAAGAELHPVPATLNLLAPKLAAFLRDRRLTQWFSVPSVLAYLHSFDAVQCDDFPELKRLMWCGEVLPTPTLRFLMERLPHATFTNLYGPTETTIASSYYTVPEMPVSPTDSIPIGTACRGESLYVLDEELSPVPTSVIGDLYIAGVGLSPGYWRDPAKTDEVFLEGPFEHVDEERLYRTGDLASVDADGCIFFHGRSDTQIKSRGYRIELGEIEAALATLEDLRESAVVAVDRGGFEGSLICCAYAPEDGVDVSVAQIKAELSTLLPKYMLPARWARLDALPRTSNGKVARPRLRAYFLDEVTS